MASLIEISLHDDKSELGQCHQHRAQMPQPSVCTESQKAKIQVSAGVVPLRGPRGASAFTHTQAVGRAQSHVVLGLPGGFCAGSWLGVIVHR